MSGQDWSITITPNSNPGGPASYTPDVMGAKAGDPLQTGNADIVSWNNRTPDEHQPWPLGSDGKPLSEADAKSQNLYLSDVIAAWQSSSPGYVTAAVANPNPTTIEYTCTFHPDEYGSIEVWLQ
jgi:hypothetical protein